MIVDGKGQIGEALKGYKGKVIIYHAWSLDKSEKVQKKCYDKFIKFVDSTPGEICFISTYSNQDDSYVKYKRLAESYLLINQRGYVVRLPTLMGKGICEDFKKGEVKPFGVMELMTVEDAADKIIYFTTFPDNPSIIRVAGEKISANLVYNLIKFGSKK